MSSPKRWSDWSAPAVAAIAALFAHALLFIDVAHAHPLSQGALEAIVHPDHVSVRARVTVEEVIITDLMTTPLAPDAPPTEAAPTVKLSFDATYARHARYLAEHLRVTADGVPLVGTVEQVTPPPTTRPAGAQAPPPDREHAVYMLTYQPPPGAAAVRQPKTVEFSQDVLVGLEFSPGVTWEASYAMRVAVPGGPVTEGLLLTSKQPVTFNPDWQGATASTTTAGEVRVNRGQLFRDYLVHGIRHILAGWDHLLFISALVLAATSVWDLVKVVSAFTLAHTITLTLAALRLVHVPSSIVEPMIAASIVFVAAQNVFWPRQTRGWGRLAVAFGFGLFHGLGFAGGLLDAMQEMSGLTIVLAILAFSVGVELGHQMIVLPLFAALRLARATKREMLQRDRVSRLALRYGSAVICCAGMYYLVSAVTSALTVAGRS
jgi:hydrogenase/urease accessory protein HupE